MSKSLTESVSVSRRTILGSIATGIVGTVGAVTMLDRSTETAAASVSMGSLDVSGDNVTTNSGTIKDLRAEVSGQWSFEIQEGNPEYWEISLLVANNDDTAVVGTTQGNMTYHQYSDNYTVSGSILDTDLFDASYFAVSKSGHTKTVTLPIMVLFQLIGQDERILAHTSIEDTAEIRVTKSSYDATLYGKVSGSGSVEIVTESG